MSAKPKTLQQAILYFADPHNCLNCVAKLRWPDGVECPTCGREDAVFLQNQGKWQCKSVHPKRQFSVKVGTVFEDSALPLDKWLIAIWMIANCKNGVSSYEVARALGTRFLFTERDAATKKMALRRGFQITPGETAVVVEDVITTGGSTYDVVELVRAAGARVVVAGSIIDRSGGRADAGVPRVALATITAATHHAEACPLCKQGIPVAKPGSRPS